MGRKKRKVLILICILLFIVVFNPKYMKHFQNVFQGVENNVINIMEIELPHSNQITYKKIDDSVLQYWDGILYSYNMKGSQNWSINININNPIIETSKNNIYLVDKAQKQIIKINKEGEVVYRTILNKGIGFINGDDDILLVYHLPENNLIRSLSVLDGNGKKSCEIVINDGEIVNTAVSNGNGSIIINTMGISNGKIEGKEINYNLAGELILLKGIEDQIIINMYFDNQGNLITVYENKIVSRNKKQEINWELTTDKLIKVVGLSGEEIVTYGGEGRNSILQGRSREKVQVIDSKGRIIGESKPSETIMGIDPYGEDFITYSSRSIYLFNKKGEILMEHKFSVDIEEAFLLPNRHIAVISKEKLCFMKIQ